MSEKILIVDDNDMVGEPTKLILELLGFEADLVYSGEDAVIACQHTAFDAVLIDYHMPGMDGKETYYALKKIRPTMRTFFYTGDLYAEELLRIIDEEKGQVQLIYKPARKEDFRVLSKERVATS